MPDVFINFRHGDEDATAALIEHDLSDRFGSTKVFRDSKSIRAGDDFARELFAAVHDCKVMLAVIGDRWLTNANGDRLLEREQDWIRRELLEARAFGVRVIPVLVGVHVRPLDKADLPLELAWLADMQHRPFSTRNTRSDLDRLAAELAELVPGLVEHPSARPDSMPRNDISDVHGNVTIVGGDSGAVTNVSGHQFNGPTYYVTSTERLERRGRDPTAVAREQLIRLHVRYVEPEGYGDALTNLRDHRCVLLTGVAGAGRRAAGQVLLYRLGGDGPVQELPDTPTAPDEPVLDRDAVASGNRLLLDLSTTAERHLPTVLRELPAYLSTVQDKGAHLAVLLAADREYLLDVGLRSLLVTVTRPPGLDVLRRHLDADSVPYRPEQLHAAATLVRHLREDPIRELAELARLIGLARQRSDPSTTCQDWLATALDALTKRSGEVAAEVRERQGGRQRALLLATAMLIGSPADEVDHAAGELLAAVRQPDDERPELEREDLGQQLADLGVTTDRSGRVRFAKLDYDRAVRDHFWTHFPGLRGQFRDWTGRVATADVVTAQNQATFVSHFVEQALRTNRPDDLLVLVDEWTRAGAVRSRSLPAAALAMERGLGDERHGRRFRRQVYDWSREFGLRADLAYLAIQMCADVIASTHPQEAVVRLHHLVRRQSGQVREAAESALHDLVQRDRRLFRYLLHRLATSLAGPRWHADFDLFTTVADPAALMGPPRPLIVETVVRDQLVTGWHALLAERQPDFWAGLAGEWLAAGVDERFRDRLLDVLVAACAGQGTACGRLYVTGREWARADQATRDPVAHRLADKIDRAQGLDLPHHNEEATR
ncbi:MAG TPA: toll/interleukin-1 receptor domain-containing protein [Pseudonocardiaceae bacterium]|nr:toll/interleukin-1 receptor domain-containing protein [Pseudonocardiaceae bacterium]